MESGLFQTNLLSRTLRKGNSILQSENAKIFLPIGSTWISANAGSGKTYNLVNRVIKLLVLGVEAKKILCITFTNSAANEMKISVPLVVRLAGTNFKEGKEILDNSSLELISAENLDDAAKKIVEVIK